MSEGSYAGSVRGVGRTVSQTSGDVDHEMRLGKIPDYVNKQLSQDNSIIIAPQPGTVMRAKAEKHRASRDTKRAMKTNARVSQSVLISFGANIQPAVLALGKELQDRLYLDLMERIAQEANAELTGLSAHRDETAPHAHGQLVGFNYDGMPLSKVMDRAFRRNMQDWMLEIFQPHIPEMVRGKSLKERENDNDPVSTRIHRTVAELHRDLPLERDELKRSNAVLETENQKLTDIRRNLNARIEETKAKIVKNERLEASSREKAQLAEQNGEKAEKALKRAAIYEKRASDAKASLARLESEIADADEHFRLTTEEAEERGWKRVQARLDEQVDLRAEKRLVEAEQKAAKAMSEVSFLKRSLRVLWAIVSSVFKDESLEAVKHEHQKRLADEQSKPQFTLRSNDGPSM